MTVPSPAGDHHLPEIMRRLEEVVARLDRMQQSQEATFVRKDVYGAEQSADRAAVRDLRSDLDALAAQRRQMVTIAVSGLLLPIIVSIVVALMLTGGAQ